MQPEKTKNSSDIGGSSDNRWKNKGASQSDSMTSSVAAVGGQIVDNIGETASQFSERAVDIATNFKDKAQEYGGKALDETSTLIKKYPAQSLLAGFGLGLVCGLLFARR